MAEQIDTPFGLWTRMGRRNRVKKGQCPTTGASILKCSATSCRGLCKTAEMINLSFRLWTRMESTRWVVLPSGAKYAPRHFAVSCGKSAKLIDLPFGLWTLLDRRKYKFSHLASTSAMAIWAYLKLLDYFLLACAVY